jgi:hypothetical protein
MVGLFVLLERGAPVGPDDLGDPAATVTTERHSCERLMRRSLHTWRDAATRSALESAIHAEWGAKEIAEDRQANRLFADEHVDDTIFFNASHPRWHFRTSGSCSARHMTMVNDERSKNHARTARRHARHRTRRASQVYAAAATFSGRRDGIDHNRRAFRALRTGYQPRSGSTRRPYSLHDGIRRRVRTLVDAPGSIPILNLASMRRRFVLGPSSADASGRRPVGHVQRRAASPTT